jgi:hypothetical protein
MLLRHAGGGGGGGAAKAAAAHVVPSFLIDEQAAAALGTQQRGRKGAAAAGANAAPPPALHARAASRERSGGASEAHVPAEEAPNHEVTGSACCSTKPGLFARMLHGGQSAVERCGHAFAFPRGLSGLGDDEGHLGSAASR